MSEWDAERWHERNRQVIQELRSGGGAGTPDRPVLILTTTGAKSGRQHETPLMYLADGARFVVFASKGGSPTHPAWYHNLVANPQVRVEVNGDAFDAEATEIKGEERDRIYSLQSEMFPMFADYQAGTKRKIPVILLERQGERPA